MKMVHLGSSSSPEQPHPPPLFGKGDARSCEVFGDATDREIVFEAGSVAALAGRSVMLDCELSDVDVYSFAFAE